LECIMDDAEASSASRVAAAKEIIRLAGITNPENKSDKGSCKTSCGQPG